ncbi:MAG TPA: ABC transporter permease [Bacteroidota bacterium]|nr:ABC transporter permease [Bacteroidota bacterium]
MSFERKIALRYLFSKRRLNFVTVISFISIVGVTIGVAALVITLSVFNGFSSVVTSILIEFDPHVRIEATKRADSSAYAELDAYLTQSRDVLGHAPYVLGKALVVSRNINRVINVKGIDHRKVREVSGLEDKLVFGSVDVGARNGIVLGMNLADRLGTVVGDTVAVVSPAGSELALLQLGQPIIRRFVVVGIYESNNKEYDGQYAFISVQSAQRLFGRGKTIGGIELRLTSMDKADTFRKTIEEKFGSAFRVLTWYDLHRDLYTVMKIERWMAFVILSLIIGIASFNLLGSLTMTVVEKTRDIGILRSMGATDLQILKIFRYEGLLVGIIGSIAGLCLGGVIVYLQDRFHLRELDPTVYIIPAIPVELQVLDIVIIAATAIALSWIAAVYPARRAARLIPVEAIRWE